MRTSGSRSFDEGATQLADAGVTKELHLRENDGIVVWLLWSRHSHHPHTKG
jgi:hypothetical protein